MKRLAKLLIIVMLFPAVSFAQGRRGGMRGRARGGAVQMNDRTALLILSALLNLSDSQQQQLGTAFDAAVKTAAPLAAQIEAGKEALFEAVESEKSDDQIKNLAEQQGSLSSQMLVLQAQTFSKMWALLTSDQKSEVDASMYDDIGEFLSNAKPAAAPGSGRGISRRTTEMHTQFTKSSIPFATPVSQGCINQGRDHRDGAILVCWAQRHLSWKSEHEPRFVLIGNPERTSVGLAWPPYLVYNSRDGSDRWRMFRIGFRYDRNWRGYIFPTAAWKWVSNPLRY